MHIYSTRIILFRKPRHFERYCTPFVKFQPLFWKKLFRCTWNPFKLPHAASPIFVLNQIYELDKELVIQFLRTCTVLFWLARQGKNPCRCTARERRKSEKFPIRKMAISPLSKPRYGEKEEGYTKKRKTRRKTILHAEKFSHSLKNTLSNEKHVRIVAVYRFAFSIDSALTLFLKYFGS